MLTLPKSRLEELTVSLGDGRGDAHPETMASNNNTAK